MTYGKGANEAPSKKYFWHMFRQNLWHFLLDSTIYPLPPFFLMLGFYFIKTPLFHSNITPKKAKISHLLRHFLPFPSRLCLAFWCCVQNTPRQPPIFFAKSGLGTPWRLPMKYFRRPFRNFWETSRQSQPKSAIFFDIFFPFLQDYVWRFDVVCKMPLDSPPFFSINRV